MPCPSGATEEQPADLIAQQPPVPENLASSEALVQGLLLWLFEKGFKVSSGTVEWYIGSYGTDFDNSEIASPVVAFGEDGASKLL